MKYLNLAVLLLTASSTFASDKLPCDEILKGYYTLTISKEGHLRYTHNPYQSPITASEINYIAERIANTFQHTIPSEFSILLKLLDRLSSLNKHDVTIETTKRHIIKTLRPFMLKAALEMCETPLPANTNEHAAILGRLQESLHLFSNIKLNLVEDSLDYNQAVQVVYELIIKFIDAEYFRLSKLAPFENDTQKQYDQIIDFFKTLNLNVFDAKKIQIIKCYHITMVLGGANIYGIKMNNFRQLQLAQNAKDLTISLSSNIESAYLDGKPFIRERVIHACDKIINKAKKFLKMDEIPKAPHPVATEIDSPKIIILPRYLTQSLHTNKRN